MVAWWKAANGVGVLRRAWYEVPDLVGSLGLTAIGMVLCGAVIFRHNAETAHVNKIKYTVIREEDIKEKDRSKIGTIFN